ncbi:hypothetical protein GE061_004566 [Apolygus lucorum]|uniref:Uncharacterized protein n=1 Tax=Apolygus lucorum TaxID=248454 RepID=A0A6A4J464_APOLU|nr:hypothetical protein GE061_004566 [Apolygus lucorum]
MSQPSNDDDSAANVIDGPQRPLARKKSSKSRFGLVQKFHEETTTEPSSSCSEILSSLSREEREFVQGLFPPIPRNAISRRPNDRPARSSRIPGRRLALRRAMLQNVNVRRPGRDAAVGTVVVNFRMVQGIVWKIVTIMAVFLIAVLIGQRKLKETQEHNMKL